jgi:hypothetical protein
MSTTTVSEAAKDIARYMSVALKRFWILYRNGGYEDEWAFARVFNDVVDINTKISITGLVMRKSINGKWIHRQLTEEERGDFDANRSW